MIRKLLALIQKTKHHLIFILAVFISIVLVYNSNSPQLIKFNSAVSNITTFLKSPFARLEVIMQTTQENEILRERLLELSLEREILLKNKVENERLQKLLEFKEASKYNLISAKIINSGISSALLSVTIDVGKNDGVQKNNPVVTPSGIVGIIYQVNDNNSVVQLISDPDFRVGVRILPSAATGILRWRMDNICDIREVYKNAHINVGDRVVSSGLSDIFPPDLPIGIVTSVANDRSQFHKVVSVKIDDNLSAIIHLFVLISEDSLK